MRKVHGSAMTGMKSALSKAAATFGMKIDTRTGNIGAAFAAHAIITNAQIRGTESLSKEALSSGVDLLFMYVSIPRGAKVGGQRLPSGYYKVRIRANVKTLRGTSEFHNSRGRVVAKMPITVERGKELHSVSGSFSRCHVMGDVGVVVSGKPIVISVTIKWC
jgi:hypothetical protein